MTEQTKNIISLFIYGIIIKNKYGGKKNEGDKSDRAFKTV